MTARIATIDRDGEAVGVIGDRDRLWPMADLSRRMGEPAFPSNVADLMTCWAEQGRMLDEALDWAKNSADDVAIPMKDANFLAPMLYPGKVLCAGANYYDHIAEMGVENTAKEDQRLFFFFKPPRNAVVGPGRTVEMPAATEKFDWEIELAVILGRTVKNVAVEDAMDAVAAVTIAIDLSARDLNRAPDTFYKLDWVAGKGNDTCCPMGPWLVPTDRIANIQDLELELAVNGEVKQHARTSGMIFSIAEQIAIASRIMTLDAGDAILTGTPAGVGAPKGTFLKPGDRIDARIERIGTLTVEIGPPNGAGA